ncbi:hypothetical protein JTB14_003687 [Gonioctena quinquepunctata]|nr:hypothetical protein JTB14_003687 [Gonioctena quinquepunctata]
MLYDKTKVRVVTICPGAVDTPLYAGHIPRYEGPIRVEVRSVLPPNYLGEHAVRIMNEGKNGSIWVIEGTSGSYEVKIPERSELKMDSQ